MIRLNDKPGDSQGIECQSPQHLKKKGVELTTWLRKRKRNMLSNEGVKTNKNEGNNGEINSGIFIGVRSQEADNAFNAKKS